MRFSLNINKKRYDFDAEPEETLLNVLRDTLHLTGTKRGCDIGVCGTCTVVINGKARRACVVKLNELGKQDVIETIEGLEESGRLHPLQEAFVRFGAVQCGFCTPGMIMAAKALLDRCPKPSREEIKRALSGNLCRCTGYRQIIDAVEFAAQVLSNS